MIGSSSHNNGTLALPDFKATASRQVPWGAHRYKHTHILAAPAFDHLGGGQKCRQEPGPEAHTISQQNSPTQADLLRPAGLVFALFSLCLTLPPRPDFSTTSRLWPERFPSSPPNFSLTAHPSICYLETKDSGIYLPASRDFPKRTLGIAPPSSSEEHH